MELKVTRYERRDAIAVVTLHRPERMNTWTGRMHHEYRHCLALANEEIVRFQITMDNSSAVRLVQCERRLVQEKQRFRPREPFEPTNALADLLASEELREIPIPPLGIGILVLAILLGLMIALIAFGGGREHS